MDNEQKENKPSEIYSETLPSQKFWNNIDISNDIIGYVRCCNNVQIVEAWKGNQ
jgi:hypothetical protein